MRSRRLTNSSLYLSRLFQGHQHPSGITTTLLAISCLPVKMLSVPSGAGNVSVDTGGEKPLLWEPLTLCVRTLPLVVTWFATFIFQD